MIVAANVRRGGGHELRCLAGGDVLQHHPEPWQALQQGRQDALDEHRLPIEHVHARVRDLAVQQQGHACLLHGLQYRVHPADVGDAGIRIGGRPRGVILHCVHEAAGLGLEDFLRRRVVRQVQGHQRLESRPGRQGRQDAPPVGGSIRHRAYRRIQVGHHDRPGEAPGGVWQHGGQHVGVPQVQVPIVGTSEGQGVHVSVSCLSIKASGYTKRSHHSCLFSQNHQLIGAPEVDTALLIGDTKPA